MTQSSSGRRCWFGQACVNDVIGGLEPLMGDRIPKRSAIAFECGDDFFPAPGCDAADDVAGRGGAEDVVAKRAVKIDIPLGIAFHRHKSQVKVGIGIQLGDRRHGARAAAPGDQRVAARTGIEQPDFDPPFCQEHAPPTQRPRPRNNGTRGGRDLNAISRCRCMRLR